MKDSMEYKGYIGSVHYNDDDEVFYGKVEFVRALISYEGTTVKNLRKAFREAVDDYLELCETEGTTPESTFSGRFNVRTGEDLHRAAATYAKRHGLYLNDVVVDALKNYLQGQEVVQ